MNTRYSYGIALFLCLILTTVQPAAAAGAERKIHLAFTFNDKASQESLFTAAASSRIEWSKGTGKSGKTALKIIHIPDKNYISSENAVRLTFVNPLPAGGIYEIFVWFYAPVAGNEGKSTLTGPGVVLNGDYERNDLKFPREFGSLPVGEWKEVRIKTPVMESPLKTVDFRIVVNEKAKHPDVWFIDDISVIQVGDLQKVAVPEWDLSLPSIADTYKSFFLIGNIMNSAQTRDPGISAMYRRQYNVMTAGNEMKPQYLSPSKGTWDFANADALIAWAKANTIKVHGHTLIWHSQSAVWLTEDAKGNPLAREEARVNMKEYIGKVAGHFQGKVISWDVVNEALDGGSSVPKDWKTVLRRNSPWYKAYENGADKAKGESGSDYIYDAFVCARLADPGATLYYNDFEETEAWKREAMARMTEDLNRKWKTDARNSKPGRPLVEGLGMQSHYWTDTLNVAEVDATIARFVKAGVKVGITELDIASGSYFNQCTLPLTKDEENAQARLYAQLFTVYKKYKGSIERVTFWGKADSQSWLALSSPTLFDRSFAAKRSYYAVIDPEAYLNPPRN